MIPARGGSKRLPKKNILPLDTKPLVSYSIEVASECDAIDGVVVSSDSRAILEIAKEYKDVEALQRAEELATDTASSIDVLLDVMQHSKKYDYIVLLQPTSPLRTQVHLQEAIELLFQKEAQSVVSVCEMEHSPLWSNTLDSSLSMEHFLREDVKGKRSQDLECYYRLNGAIYICAWEQFHQERSFFLKKGTFAYIMSKRDSIDIDEELDFLLAETIMKEKKRC